MQLYLGEGGDEYLGLIQEAVNLWNEALVGFNRQPVIAIADSGAPQMAQLADDFWGNASEVSTENVYDDESVIYFKAGRSSDLKYSFAYQRWDGDRMVESDIYINTTDEQRYGKGLGGNQRYHRPRRDARGLRARQFYLRDHRA